LFCDYGADPSELIIDKQNVLNYAAEHQLDKICMYLLLRTKDIDREDLLTGHNVFVTYMLRQDIKYMETALIRGANINYVSKTLGMTPLHIAIENQLPKEIIKLLLSKGADPMIEDRRGLTCKEKAIEYTQYLKIKRLMRQDSSERIKGETI
jgi:ankyrin repeat protein